VLVAEFCKKIQIGKWFVVKMLVYLTNDMLASQKSQYEVRWATACPLHDVGMVRSGWPISIGLDLH